MDPEQLGIGAEPLSEVTDGFIEDPFERVLKSMLDFPEPLPPYREYNSQNI